ncbi:MAG: hypothetical protein J1E78_01135 [Muribaculaceae bacterium]|nr:hypothetical protein [Muribaculaceae bacterium]
MSVFVQIIILLAVLATMVMVLLAIRQLTNFEGFDDARETDSLKHEVEDKNSVLSRNNIFHTLVESEVPREDESIENNKEEKL